MSINPLTPNTHKEQRNAFEQEQINMLEAQVNGDGTTPTDPFATPNEADGLFGFLFGRRKDEEEDDPYNRGGERISWRTHDEEDYDKNIEEANDRIERASTEPDYTEPNQ